jgi:hypothetical protein
MAKTDKSRKVWLQVNQLVWVNGLRLSHGCGPSDAHDEDEGGQQGGAEVDEDDDDHNYDVGEEVEYDVVGMSQLDDAPQGTQQSSGHPHRIPKPVDRYTPGTYPLVEASVTLVVHVEVKSLTCNDALVNIFELILIDVLHCSACG